MRGFCFWENQNLPRRRSEQGVRKEHENGFYLSLRLLQPPRSQTQAPWGLGPAPLRPTAVRCRFRFRPTPPLSLSARCAPREWMGLTHTAPPALGSSRGTDLGGFRLHFPRETRRRQTKVFGSKRLDLVARDEFSGRLADQAQHQWTAHA